MCVINEENRGGKNKTQNKKDHTRTQLKSMQKTKQCVYECMNESTPAKQNKINKKKTVGQISFPGNQIPTPFHSPLLFIYLFILCKKRQKNI